MIKLRNGHGGWLEVETNDDDGRSRVLIVPLKDVMCFAWERGIVSVEFRGFSRPGYAHESLRVCVDLDRKGFDHLAHLLGGPDIDLAPKKKRKRRTAARALR